MYSLFELDEQYSSLRLFEIVGDTDPSFKEKHIAVSFRAQLLDNFMREWMLRKKQLAAHEIIKAEYLNMEAQLAADGGRLREV